MKLLLPLLCLSVVATPCAWSQSSAKKGKVVFEDDFSKKGFDKRWGHYKSASEIRDGVLVGITPEGSDHSAVDHVIIDPEQDLEVAVKFRYVSDKAKSFNVWFDDKGYKGSHAGHICSVTVSPKTVTMSDAKTGNFRNEIYEKRKSPEGLSDAEKKMLADKSKTVPVQLSLKDWHELVIITRGKEVTVKINGREVGSLKGEGIAHETKTLISLTTNPVDVEYDDFSIKVLPKAKK